MNARFDRIPSFAPGKDGYVHAVIETPAGTRHKYAFGPHYGVMKLKSTLAEGLAWPYDYGFVPHTIGGDGDPVDILVLNDAPTFSSCLIETRILGGILLLKNGEENDRLVAAPPRRKGVSLKTDAYDDLGDIPDALLDGLKDFLVQYSQEQGNEIAIKDVCSRKKALKVIDKAGKAYERR